ncbi:MAG: MBL fold metallo-hydrolase, partial [Tepidisphaeraceae bacterium]
MRIQFLGADRTVTGSCHLLEVNNRRVLLDCGMFQGPRDTARQLNTLLADDPRSIEAVILSHGHLDHCGKLPVLVRAGFSGPIWCTPGTADVTRIILEDSARIQDEDAEYLNRRARRPGEPQFQPLYGAADVPPVLTRFRTIEYGRPVELWAGLSFRFFDAGHILGSAYAWLECTEDGRTRRVLFTGDIGRYDTPILNDPQAPPGAADLVITESTYGGRSHGPISEVGPQLLEAMRDCVARKSRLLVPSFALGRSQTILWYACKFIAEKELPPIPIYVDSPMAVEVSRAYVANKASHDEQTRRLFGDLDPKSYA